MANQVKTMESAAPKLYRGFAQNFVDGEYPNIFLTHSRLPKAVNEAAHCAADEWFLDKFGVRGRSQAILCSTCVQQAASYVGENGTLGEITPTSEFKAVFCTNVKDFVQYAFETTASDIVTWLDSQGYECVTDISLLPIGFKGEVMLACESFYLRQL